MLKITNNKTLAKYIFNMLVYNHSNFKIQVKKTGVVILNKFDGTGVHHFNLKLFKEDTQGKIYGKLYRLLKSNNIKANETELYKFSKKCLKFRNDQLEPTLSEILKSMSVDEKKEMLNLYLSSKGDGIIERARNIKRKKVC